MGYLFILFAVMPIIEITLLIHIGEIIGGWNTVGIVIATAFIGAYLVKREGISTLTSAQQKMQQGQVPGNEMAEGLLLLVAGVLLVTPGFVTDIIGLLFTFPPTRKGFAKALLGKMAASPNVKTHFATSDEFTSYSQNQPHHSSKGQVFEGEYRDKDNERSRKTIEHDDDNL